MLAEERRAENTGAGSGGLGTRGAARAGVCVGGDTTSRPCHIAAKLHLPQRVPVLPPASATEAPAPEGGRIKLPQKKIRDSGHQRHWAERLGLAVSREGSVRRCHTWVGLGVPVPRRRLPKVV